MSHVNRGRWTLIGLVGGLVAIGAGSVYSQGEQQPTNDAPNRYTSTEKWGNLPAGRPWGASNVGQQQVVRHAKR
jgi:hypothetical protein